VTWGTGLGGSGRKGLTGDGGSTVVQSEQWWGRGGAVEGAGKVVEGAHSVGVELGAVSGGGGSEWGWSGRSWWLNDDEQGGV
jgi:hypothetical protein